MVTSTLDQRSWKIYSGRSLASVVACQCIHVLSEAIAPVALTGRGQSCPISRTAGQNTGGPSPESRAIGSVARFWWDGHLQCGRNAMKTEDFFLSAVCIYGSFGT